VARFYAASGKRHIVTTQTEHKCVLDACRTLEASGGGFRVTYLPVGSDGLVTPEAVAAALAPDTALVSVMGVNNEIGVVQPLAAIGAVCRAAGVFFHTDAAQMAGKVPLDVNEACVDLASLSGHKLYGPKGVGALYVRRRPRVRLEPLISGGGQERGLRSGTLPHPLVVGLGAACEIARKEMAADAAWVECLAKRLRDGITARIPDVILNGDATNRYPGNVNFSFSYVEGESLLMALKDLAVSSGSACTSASLEPSYGERRAGGLARGRRARARHVQHTRLGLPVRSAAPRTHPRTSTAPAPTPRSPARHRRQRRPRAHVHPLRPRPLLHGAGGRLRHPPLRKARQAPARHVAAVGDGAGGHRHQDDPVRAVGGAWPGCYARYRAT